MKMALDLAALERLIGKDTEIETELRQSIVNEFTKKYLKGILDSTGYYKLKQELVVEQETLIKKYVGELCQGQDRWGYSANNVKLVDSVDKLLQKTVEDRIDVIVNKVLKDYTTRQESRWCAYAEKAARECTDKEIEKMVKEGIDKRLKAAALSEGIP